MKSYSHLITIAATIGASLPVPMEEIPNLNKIVKRQKNKGNKRLGKVGYKQAQAREFSGKGADRNKRCPCASGKKFKRCCWDKEEV